MNLQIFSFVKKINLRLSKAAVALAVSFVLLGTACTPSSSGVSSTGSYESGESGRSGVSGTGSYQSGRSNPTELYRTTQDKKGGMNQYSDTDPRQKESVLSAGAKARVDQAKSNLKKTLDADDVVDEFRAGTPLGERTKNVIAPAAKAIENTAEDVTKGTERGIKNLKGNTKDATQGVKETVNEAQDNAAQLGKDTSRGIKNTAAQLRSNADDARQDLGNKASNIADGVSRKVAPTGVDRIEALESQPQKTPKLDTPNLIERVKDTFGTATDNLGEFTVDSANDNR